MNSWPEIVRIKACGCWVITLAQGKAVILCASHQGPVLDVLEMPAQTGVQVGVEAGR